nr:hypothetical protein [Campylobacter jejuni]
MNIAEFHFSNGNKIQAQIEDNLVVCRLNEQEMEILKKLMVLDLASEYGTYIRKLILKEARTLNINN